MITKFLSHINSHTEVLPPSEVLKKVNLKRQQELDENYNNWMAQETIKQSKYEGVRDSTDAEEVKAKE